MSHRSADSSTGIIGVGLLLILSLLGFGSLQCGNLGSNQIPRSIVSHLCILANHLRSIDMTHRPTEIVDCRALIEGALRVCMSQLVGPHSVAFQDRTKAVPGVGRTELGYEDERRIVLLRLGIIYSLFGIIIEKYLSVLDAGLAASLIRDHALAASEIDVIQPKQPGLDGTSWH